MSISMIIHGFIGRIISIGSPVCLKYCATIVAVSFDTALSKVRPSPWSPWRAAAARRSSDAASARSSSSTSVPDASNAFSNTAGSGYASAPRAWTEPAR